MKYFKAKKKLFFLNGSSIVLIIIIVLILKNSFASISNIQDYNDWLNNEKNGCIKTKSLYGIKISVKYQPSTYLAFKEIKTGNKSLRNKDSVLFQQNNMLTFLMTLAPDENSENYNQTGKSIMYKGIDNYNEYVDRVMTANFGMERNIKLYIDNAMYVPVLAIVENLYELSSDRSFIVVFAPGDAQKIQKGKEFLFVYDDPYFNVGKVQFDFSGSNFKKARELNVNWN